MAFGGPAVELKAREIRGVPSIMVAEADLVLSAREEAVTTTELFVAEGSAEGAV